MPKSRHNAKISNRPLSARLTNRIRCSIDDTSFQGISALLCVTHVSGSYQVSARSFNYERDALRQIFEYAQKVLRIILEKPMRSRQSRCSRPARVLVGDPGGVENFGA